jgi:hypothetical protein
MKLFFYCCCKCRLHVVCYSVLFLMMLLRANIKQKVVDLPTQSALNPATGKQQKCHYLRPRQRTRQGVCL